MALDPVRRRKPGDKASIWGCGGASIAAINRFRDEIRYCLVGHMGSQERKKFLDMKYPTGDNWLIQICFAAWWTPFDGIVISEDMMPVYVLAHIKSKYPTVKLIKFNGSHPMLDKVLKGQKGEQYTRP